VQRSEKACDFKTKFIASILWNFRAPLAPTLDLYAAVRPARRCNEDVARFRRGNFFRPRALPL
jgi:hypothetical protein